MPPPLPLPTTLAPPPELPPPLLTPASPRPRPFFGRIRFEMSAWAASFPLDALAITSCYYVASHPGRLAQGIAYACLAAASAITANLLLQTVAAIIRRKVGWAREGACGCGVCV